MTPGHSDAWPVAVANFRDFGGAATADGRRVRTGVLFRSGNLHALSADDQARLVGLGIRLVFDLRGALEATQQPDALPAGVAYRRVGAVASLDDPTDEPLDLLDWEGFFAQASDPEVIAALEAWQHDVYPDMIRRPEAFAALVRALLDLDGAGVLVHCTAGKDRTGVACAIVQRLLGVAPDRVLADYLASDGALSPTDQAMLDRARRELADRRVRDLMEFMMGVSADKLDSAFAQMERGYGGFEGFVWDGLGLSVSDVAALRAAYLEPQR